MSEQISERDWSLRAGDNGAACAPLLLSTYMSCYKLATESEFRWTLSTGVLRGRTLRRWLNRSCICNVLCYYLPPAEPS